MGFAAVAYTPDPFFGHGYAKFYPFDSSGLATLGGIDLGLINDLTAKPPEMDKVELPSYRDPANPGQIVDSVELKRTWKGSFSSNSFGPDIWALHVYGAKAAGAGQTGTSVTDEAVTVAKLDRWYKLTKRNVNTVVVTGSGGTPTYDVDDDYIVDAWSGSIKILSTGDIAEDASILVDFAYTNLAWDEIIAGSLIEVEGRLEFEGKNVATGEDVSLIAAHVKIEPSGDFKQIGKEYAALEFAITYYVASGETGPFVVSKNYSVPT